MCLYEQAPKEAAETINLSQKVSIATPQETARGVTEEDENDEEKALPEWSEKVASGILTGEVELRLHLCKILKGTFHAKCTF